jgi:signal transduction histidine kinase/ActR/RegA family two-component response regulator
MKRALLPLLFLYGLLSVYAQDTDDIAASDLKSHFAELKAQSDEFYNSGRYKESRETNIELLKTALKIDEPYYKYMGYRFLAYDYLALNDTIQARENFVKSQHNAQLADIDSITAFSYMDQANLYSTIEGDYKTAIRYHNKAINLLEKIGDSVNLGKANYNAVLTAFEAEEYNVGYGHLLRAKNLKDKLDHKMFGVGLDILLGEYHYNTENYPLAEKYLRKAIFAAKKDSLTIELENAYLLLADCLFAQDRKDEAYSTRETYEEYADANLRSELQANMDVSSAQFQLDEYRKDVEAAEYQNMLQRQIMESQRKMNVFLFVIAFAGLMIAVLIYLAYRKRKQLVAELRHKNSEYLRAKEEMEQMARAKSRFFSTVSHELRTPLYGVIGLSTLLLEDESLKNHEGDLKSLKFSADYLLALINDVLQINKIDSKSSEEEKTYFNLRELVQTIVASFEYMRVQNDNSIHIEIDTEIPDRIRGNSVRLSQILMNLIGNACKFTESGKIHVIAELIESDDHNTSIEFSVHDTGIGIPEDKQDEIFEEFSQGESMNYEYQGSGLGLPIVKKLLALSNSEIDLKSQPGKGSVFSFQLSFENLEEASVKETVPLLDTQLFKGKHILIVEDNRINQTVTKKILEREAVRCTLAENGEVAVQLARDNDFDLILMDINMPVMNGYESTKRIRRFDKWIPIIALTAVEVEEVRYKIYDVGMNDIIVKPYDITQFSQTILKHLSGNPGASQQNGSRLQAI